MTARVAITTMVSLQASCTENKLKRTATVRAVSTKAMCTSDCPTRAPITVMASASSKGPRTSAKDRTNTSAA